MKRTRIGRLSGRWPKYTLFVDGIEVGEVARTITGGGDRMCPSVRRDGWRVTGIVLETQGQAEAELVRRAIKFGKLKETT